MLISAMNIAHIYLSKGHNFYGRYGMEPLTHETVEVESVECVAGRGLVGDRFFDYKEDYKGQITFFSMEVFEKMCDELNVYDKSPSVVRRNVFVSGVDLNALIDQTFELQGIRFSGVQECSPCEWMDQAFAPGAMDFLKNQGGLRARILSSGILKKSDEWS
jgi:MOSC domain-containing protein YiiM